MASIKSELKWFVAVAAACVLVGTLLGARHAGIRDSKSGGRYPVPEISVGAQRVVLPWEIALRDPDVQKTISRRPRKKKPARVRESSPATQETAKASASRLDQEQAQPAEPSEQSTETNETPEWKDWAPD